MNGCAFAVLSAAIFVVISHRFFLKSDRIPAKNLYNLTNKSDGC